ncbi:hypothetical protein [Halovivax cerinus]|uniref:Uncharacterized protein n=1 Tax=Halovivax cerinus TaxID=1487865 RepID=A0ABD5NSV2_9EURY|nr:hypothetical protein [Halovivax cerinus]
MTGEPDPEPGSAADPCADGANGSDEWDGAGASGGGDASADRAGRTTDADERTDGDCDLQPDDERADEERDERADAAAHLRDVPVGSGCTEIWEHLAERRDDDA